MEARPPFWTAAVEEAFGPGTRIDFARYFESKKNQVTLLSLIRGDERFEVLAKRYVWGDARREHEVLSRAHARGLAVPRPLLLQGEVCFMEPLPGNRIHPPVLPAQAEALGLWLARFHREMETPEGPLLRGDCVLPNFLATDSGALYGVDFEESRPGDPREDVAQMAVSVLLGSGAAAPGLATRFLEGYGAPPALELKQRMRADLEARLRFAPGRAAEVAAALEALDGWPGLE